MKQIKDLVLVEYLKVSARSMSNYTQEDRYLLDSSIVYCYQSLEIKDQKESEDLLKDSREQLIKALKADQQKWFSKKINSPVKVQDAQWTPAIFILLGLSNEQSSQREPVIKSLLESKSDFNLKLNEQGDTILHIATQENLVTVVNLLVNTFKINLQVTNKAGKTACDIAEEPEHREVFEILSAPKKSKPPEFHKISFLSNFNHNSGKPLLTNAQNEPSL